MIHHDISCGSLDGEEKSTDHFNGINSGSKFVYSRAFSIHLLALAVRVQNIEGCGGKAYCIIQGQVEAKGDEEESYSPQAIQVLHQLLIFLHDVLPFLFSSKGGVLLDEGLLEFFLVFISEFGVGLEEQRHLYYYYKSLRINLREKYSKSLEINELI